MTTIPPVDDLAATRINLGHAAALLRHLPKIAAAGVVTAEQADRASELADSLDRLAVTAEVRPLDDLNLDGLLLIYGTEEDDGAGIGVVSMQNADGAPMTVPALFLTANVAALTGEVGVPGAAQVDPVNVRLALSADALVDLNRALVGGAFTAALAAYEAAEATKPATPNGAYL